jgi:cobalt-zinc-cadmium efflux system protein
MHTHHHGHHNHPAAVAPPNLLPAALGLTLLFAAVEALAGWWAGSLALVGDAGHMLTDSLALGLAALAAWLARQPPSSTHSYGYARVEVLAALVNAGFMLAVVIGICWSATARLMAPRPVAGEVVTWVAAAGLLINALVAWLLTRGERTMNLRGALLHVLGDLLGSVAALASGIVISTTGWTPIDPLLSVFICALILASTLRLAREAVHTLIDGVPDEISLPDVGRRLAATSGVMAVHDLHIWSLSSSRVALSAHVVVSNLTEWQSILPRLRHLLEHDFHIDHVTLQPEVAPESLHPLPDPAAPSRRA